MSLKVFNVLLHNEQTFLNLGLILNRLPKSRVDVINLLKKCLPVSILNSWINIIRKSLATAIEDDEKGNVKLMRYVHMARQIY